jgi:hypothetical protein
MKRTTALLALLAALACVPGAFAQSDLSTQAPPQAGSSAPQTADANAQKGRALLDKMITALGGQAYLQYTTKTEVGRGYGFYQGEPNSVGTRFWRFWKYPDKERVELTKKRDIIQIIVGDKGYETTYKGTAEIEPDVLRDTLRRRAHSLEIVLRQWLRDPGTQVFYDGTALAEQKSCDSVTLLTKDNDSVTIFIDQITSLPVKRSFTYRDPVDNLKDQEGESYANFRPIQGIVTPLTVTRTHNGLMTNQRFLTEVHYNVDIPDSQFNATVTYDPYKRSGPRH